MYDCSRKRQVQRCRLGKFLLTSEWDVSSEGHEQSWEEALNLKSLPNSMILQNLSSPAASNWAVLLNIVFCFSFAFWLWLFEFSSSLLHSVCLGSFPASFSLLLALCSLAPLPAFPPTHPATEPEKEFAPHRGPVEWDSRTLFPGRRQTRHRLHQVLSLRMAKEQLLHSLLHRFGRESREW